MPQEIALNQLKPHPRNVLIYGEENVSDLVAQIKERDRIVVPLIITPEYVILSGHRRWEAAKHLGLETVPCEIREFESPEEELEFLLHSNITRKKSNEQLAREGIALEEVLSTQSAERRNAKLKQFQSVRDDSSLTVEEQDNDPDEDTEGRTRDAIAKVLKIKSGKQFDRMKAVIHKADKLNENGQIEDAALFFSVLNRSASAAYDLTRVPLESLSEENRNGIKSGKVAPRQFLPDKEKEKDKSQKGSPHKQFMGEINRVNKSIQSMKRTLSRVENEVERSKIHAALLKTTQSLQALLPTVEVEAD